MPIELKDTITVELPVTGQQAVLRGYVTGRIKQAISRIMLEGTTVTNTGKLDNNGNRVSDTEIKATATQDMNNKAIELIVLSIGAKTEGILDAVLDLPEDDYDVVLDAVKQVQAPLVPKTGTSSESTTDTPLKA